MEREPFQLIAALKVVGMIEELIEQVKFLPYKLGFGYLVWL